MGTENRPSHSILHFGQDKIIKTFFIQYLYLLLASEVWFLEFLGIRTVISCLYNIQYKFWMA